MISQSVTSSDDFNRSYKAQNSVRDDSFSSSRWKNKSYSSKSCNLSFDFGILDQNLHSDSPSGFESDSAALERQKQTGRRSKVRGRRSSSRQDDCFSLRVEDFPDTEFDFEANLAKFDKKAFYEMTDAKCSDSGTGNGCRQDLSPDHERVLVEGPNGIGYVPARKFLFKSHSASDF